MVDTRHLPSRPIYIAAIHLFGSGSRRTNPFESNFERRKQRPVANSCQTNPTRRSRFIPGPYPRRPLREPISCPRASSTTRQPWLYFRSHPPSCGICVPLPMLRVRAEWRRCNSAGTKLKDRETRFASPATPYALTASKKLGDLISRSRIFLGAQACRAPPDRYPQRGRLLIKTV